MKLYRLTKFVSAEKATQAKAEQLIGKKITNLQYGTDGYVVLEDDGKMSWMPKTVFEKMAELMDTPINVCKTRVAEIEEEIKYVDTLFSNINVCCNERQIKMRFKSRLKALIKDYQNVIHILLMRL